MAEGVVIAEWTGFRLASVMARKGVGAEAVGEALGLAAPTGPAIAGDRRLSLIGVGPGAWLALGEPGPDLLEETLRSRLGALASLSEQSGAYRFWRLSGPGARVMLQRGAAIDLDARAFGPGSACVTVISHIGVLVWQEDDAPTYIVGCFRSLGGSFSHWLAITAAAL